mgnify:CR=1 FL=1
MLDDFKLVNVQQQSSSCFTPLVKSENLVLIKEKSFLDNLQQTQPDIIKLEEVSNEKKMKKTNLDYLFDDG